MTFDSVLADTEAAIRLMFCQALRTVPVKRLTVESMPRDCVEVMPLDAAITDALDSDVGNAALFTVLEKSDCPHVQALREVLAARHIYHHARDIANAITDPELA